ncbi:MAG: hypothetical protein J6P87_03120 [Lachnospiraceae bacterium]|nr:hypothetical protein [Lachnospiraceae bacterium]
MDNSSRFARGMGRQQFHASAAPLTFSAQLIEHQLSPGEVKEASFTIYSQNEEGLEGEVSSSQAFVRPVTRTFSGNAEEITYKVSAAAFDDGDIAEGFFRIISSQGEYTLPYQITVKQKELTSPIGVIENLNHFVSLARTNWKQACALFYSPDFERVLENEPPRLSTVYRGLSGNKNNELNVDEFLITADKKKAAEYLADCREVHMELHERDLSELAFSSDPRIEKKIALTRNGWGYTRLRFESSGDFIYLTRSVMDASEFEGNHSSFSYRIDPDRLHPGRNFGEIRILAPFSSIRIPVEIHLKVHASTKYSIEKEKKRLCLQIMQDYEAYRGRKLGGREWLERTNACAQRLSSIDRSDPVPVLYQIHAALTAGRSKDAMMELDRLCRRMARTDAGEAEEFSLKQYEAEDETAYCYRMYLTSLCNAEDEEITEAAASIIEEAHKREPANWRISWLLMYSSQEYLTRPATVWQELARLYEEGVRSPVIYIEAMHIIQTNPAMLTELSDFELQVLNYGAKKGELSPSVITQINYLSKRARSFSKRLYRILVSGYEASTSEAGKRETLESICILLIKGNLTDPQYFEWYSKGVDEGLQLTRLFEYYLMSMPEDAEIEIPRIVLMYYQYQAAPESFPAAHLYRYIWEKRDEDPDMYSHYEQRIDEFTLEQIRLHRINDHLAVLYDRYLKLHVPDDAVAKSLIPLLFTGRLAITRPAIRRVFLLYDCCQRELEWPMEDGVCILPVYGDDNQIFFEDDAGNRYAKSIASAFDRWMDYEKYSETMEYFDPGEFCYDLYLSSLGETRFPVTEERIQRFLRLSRSERLLFSCRQDLKLRLLKYYEDNGQISQMRNYLETMPPAFRNRGERGTLIHYLVEAGLFAKALEWVRVYGTASVDSHDLLLMVCGVLEEGAPEDDPEFAQIAHAAYLGGKYNEKLLAYLSEEFEGLTGELEQIRTSMQGFSMDDQAICRRMALQCLYTGEQPSDMDALTGRLTDASESSELIASLLAQSAHYYVVFGKAPGSGVIRQIGLFGRGGEALLDVCRIAYLKYYAALQGELNQDQSEVIRLFLKDLLREGIIFPFFRQFTALAPELSAYADETLVEYDDPMRKGTHIVYHYCLDDPGKSQIFSRRDMQEMYEGIYVTGFLLFFGEQMHYFITDDADEKNIVESGTVGQDARISDDLTDRFGRINSIEQQLTLHRAKEAFAALEEYDRLSFLVSQLFEDHGNTEG